MLDLKHLKEFIGLHIHEIIFEISEIISIVQKTPLQAHQLPDRFTKCDKFLLKEALCISGKRREQPPAFKHFQVGIFLINRFFFCVSAGFPAFSGAQLGKKNSNAEWGSSMCDSFVVYMSLIYI